MDRRRSLKVLASVPAGFLVGFNSTLKATAILASDLTPSQTLKKLIIMLGPWSTQQKRDAEDFANRFLRAKHMVKPFLPESAVLLQNIANHFSNDNRVLKEINLEEFSTKEQKLLSQLVSQLYNLKEIRYLTSNEQPYGICQSNPISYIKIPASIDNM